jgi:DNA-binding MarR family transcriptional regulator
VDRSEKPSVLADRLHSAAIHLLRRLRRFDVQSGVSAAQLSALSVLMGGPRTLGELAAAEQVTSPTMSRLVREMEQLGLVTRSRDGADARLVWVEWTDNGRSALQTARDLRLQALRAQIDSLAAEERVALQWTLDVLDGVLSRL